MHLKTVQELSVSAPVEIDLLPAAYRFLHQRPFLRGLYVLGLISFAACLSRAAYLHLTSGMSDAATSHLAVGALFSFAISVISAIEGSLSGSTTPEALRCDDRDYQQRIKILAKDPRFRTLLRSINIYQQKQADSTISSDEKRELAAHWLPRFTETWIALHVAAGLAVNDEQTRIRAYNAEIEGDAGVPNTLLRPAMPYGVGQDAPQHTDASTEAPCKINSAN